MKAPLATIVKRSWLVKLKTTW